MPKNLNLINTLKQRFKRPDPVSIHLFFMVAIQSKIVLQVTSLLISNYKYFIKNIINRNYFWKYFFPPVISIFGAYGIFFIQHRHELKIQSIQSLERNVNTLTQLESILNQNDDLIDRVMLEGKYDLLKQINCIYPENFWVDVMEAIPNNQFLTSKLVKYQELCKKANQDGKQFYLLKGPYEIEYDSLNNLYYSDFEILEYERLPLKIAVLKEIQDDEKVLIADEITSFVSEELKQKTKINNFNLLHQRKLEDLRRRRQ